MFVAVVLVDMTLLTLIGRTVPASTPAAVVDKLFKDTTRVLKSPDVIERFAKEGINVNFVEIAKTTKTRFVGQQRQCVW